MHVYVDSLINDLYFYKINTYSPELGISPVGLSVNDTF
jgi:hypothetical protein